MTTEKFPRVEQQIVDLIRKNWQWNDGHLGVEVLHLIQAAGYRLPAPLSPIGDKTEDKLTYPEWKLELIKLFAETNYLKPFLKLEEIKCVLRDDCDYPERFKEGESPADMFEGEIDAIADSQ